MPVTFSLIETGIGLLEVNRPEARNALNWQDMDAFASCVEQARQTDGLAALIITGAGSAFIAGGDLKELHNFSASADALRLSDRMGTALQQMEELPCPVIAAINGPARGGGVEIALACDLRVVSENATLGLVQVNLGLTPGWGAAQKLVHLVGYARAFELLTLGRVLSAAEALSFGLANRIDPFNDALDMAIELARTLRSQPQSAVLALKRILQANLRLPPEQARQMEQAEFIPLWTGAEHRQAVERFLQARKDK